MGATTLATVPRRLSLLAALCLATPAGAADEPAGMKAAARAQVAKAAPSVRIDHLEIRRIVDDYAVVTVYPDRKINLTDPAMVILHREGKVWKAVAGPGTAFPPGSRAGAPDPLFDPVDPYTGGNARNAINRLKVARKTFKNARIRFQYPADAVVEARRGQIRVIGPKVRERIFHGPAYEILITPLTMTIRGALDDWGVARMRESIRQREAEAGPGGPNTQPESATYFHLEKSDLFQIDWSAGDSTIRELYVIPKGGRRVVKIVTRVYPIQNNPGAPRAESAVNLVLHTLTPARPRAAAFSPTPARVALTDQNIYPSDRPATSVWLEVSQGSGAWACNRSYSWAVRRTRVAGYPPHAEGVPTAPPRTLRGRETAPGTRPSEARGGCGRRGSGRVRRPPWCGPLRRATVPRWSSW
jgi:hypothetical protein